MLYFHSAGKLDLHFDVQYGEVILIALSLDHKLLLIINKNQGQTRSMRMVNESKEKIWKVFVTIKYIKSRSIVCFRYCMISGSFAK